MGNLTLKTNILNEKLNEINFQDYSEKVNALHIELHDQKYFETGWLTLPIEKQDGLNNEINELANEIRLCADVLVVIGIGGSFLGARAVQDALRPYFGKHENGIEVIYVGQNMSGAYMDGLLKYIADKRFYVNVISKSGGTMEPALAFRVLRKYTEERYGDSAKERIIVTTDPEKGLLREMALTSDYRQFTIPQNIGGRYSVLTPVGLLPIAVSGIDINQLMEGAKAAANELMEPSIEKNQAYKYAVIRNILYSQGYKVELLASFEPALNNLHEWWKQLFGESEGKEGKGLYPSTVNFSTDLHSMGQFIQDGSAILFETLLHFKNIENNLSVPLDERDEDNLNYLAGRTFNEINGISKEGTVNAHSEGGVPVIQFELEKLDAYHIGYLLYFFMKACAISALLLDVYPFDQPGVEAYKKKIMELLKDDEPKVVK